MRRRRFLLPFLLAMPIVCVAADPSQEVWEVLTQVASALSARNPQAVLAAFDPAMPGYDRLRDSVTALLRDADVQSAVELESDDGNGEERTEELDWLLNIRVDGDATASARREQRVKCKLRKSGKKWLIVAFDPLDFLTPPRK